MRLTLIILFFSLKLFGQDLTARQINNYVKTIDSLRTHKKLTKIKLSNMSWCGGGVSGYYSKDKLVYISSTYGAEYGYSEKKVYLKDTVSYKIIYHQHFVDWDKYYKTNSDQEIDEKKLHYGDTTYTLLLASPLKITKESGGKLFPTIFNSITEEHLLKCASVMRKELENEVEKQKSL